MTEETFNRRLEQLVKEVMQHPHSEEILRLANEQLADDTVVLVQTAP